MSGGYKICVVGGAGGIGQPLSLLLALDPDVAELSIYGLRRGPEHPRVSAEGVAMDLSHIDSPAKVTAYSFDKDDRPIDKAGECLTGAHLVMVLASAPRKPGQERKDLLAVNAGIVKNIVEACAKFCPEAVLGLIVNPVNSIVPAMCEMWKKKGLNPSKIIGVTTLDVLRTNRFVHEITGEPAGKIQVPVVGGHAGKTILPLFSQDEAAAKIPASQISDLDAHVQDAGFDVVRAKNDKGTATLSMAVAAARLARAILGGLKGEARTECAFVMSPATQLPYFASKVTFGPEGVERVHGLGVLNGYEWDRLEALLPMLKEEIDAGLEYAAANELAS